MRKPCEKYREYKICYNCGKVTCLNKKCKDKDSCQDSYTKEHIPPRSFFKQDNLSPKGEDITVSCCRECNNNYSADDGYWLNIITIHSSAFNKMAKEVSLNKRIPAIKEHNNKLLLELVNGYEILDVKTKGGIYVAKTGSVRMDFAKINTINTKIVKGFLHKNFKKILTSSPVFKWSNMLSRNVDTLIVDNDQSFINIIKIIKSGHIGTEEYRVYNREIDTFKYGYIANFPDENSLLFFLEFYDCVQFLYQVDLN